MDVAYNNQGVNWPLAKSGGVRGGIAKASEGILIEDSQFKNNWKQMADAGVPRGAYHFYRQWAGSGPQAKKFVSVLNKYGGVKKGDVLALDDEEEGLMSLKSMIDFTYNVESMTGIVCIWYSWAWMLNNLNMRKLSSSQIEYLSKILVWGAGYPDNPDLYTSVPKFYTADPTKFGKTILWQYKSEVPNVQGIPGGTDVNWVDPDFLSNWESGSGITSSSSLPPIQEYPIGFPKNGTVIAQPSVRIRTGPGTNFPSLGLLLNGASVIIVSTAKDSEGNTWGRLNGTPEQWIAVNHGGSVYVQYK